MKILKKSKNTLLYDAKKLTINVKLSDFTAVIFCRGKSFTGKLSLLRLGLGQGQVQVHGEYLGHYHHRRQGAPTFFRRIREKAFEKWISKCFCKKGYDFFRCDEESRNVSIFTRKILHPLYLKISVRPLIFSEKNFSSKSSL